MFPLSVSFLPDHPGAPWPTLEDFLLFYGILCFHAFWGVRGVGKWPPYTWKPLIVGTLPQALFFSQKNGPHISGSPELVGTLPQALFFPGKRPPYFWKPLACGYVAAGAFFSGKKGPHISGSPELWGGLIKK